MSHDSLIQTSAFDQTLIAVRDVPGWLHDEQARRLWEAARDLIDGAQIVEIGSYHGRSTITLAQAASGRVAVVAIDPHAGNDRGPGEWEGSPEDGRRDHIAFERNLRDHGVDRRVRHVCKTSSSAHVDVEGEIDLLYVDGSHRYRNALADLRDWGSRVRSGGTMFVHDAYGSVFVTAAIYRSIALASNWRYVGRERSLAEYRREPVRGSARIMNVLRQLAALPWFARNLAVKLLCAVRLERLAAVFGHRPGDAIY
jgi:predicted O-methyltransferase YrrM